MKNLIDIICLTNNIYNFKTFEEFCFDNAKINENCVSDDEYAKINDIIEDAYINTFFITTGLCSFCTYQEFLFETLTRSYDLEKLFKTLVEKYKYARFTLKDTFEKHSFIDNILGRKKRYHLYINVKYDKRKNNLLNDNSFKSLMNLYNCFVTRKIETDTIVDFYIEQTYSNDVTQNTYKENRFLYHITSEDKLYKIKKYGLIAKEGKRDYFNHPSRIYVLKESTSFDELKKFAELLYPDKNYTILKIDLKKIKTPKNEKLRFYIDPAYGSSRNGLYTLGPILPSCIEEININK